MDFNETMLKERFETAVGGISPDVARIVGAGSDLGAGMRRRRRSQGFGAAVASVAAVVGIAYVGIGQGLFDSNTTGPADGSVSQAPTVPSTPRSLVAVALEHLPDDEVVGAGTMGDSPDGSSVFASLGLDTDQGKAQLDLVATAQVRAWDRQPPCAPGTQEGEVLDCQTATLPDGGKLVISVEKYEADGSTGYVVFSGVRRADQVVGVIEHLPDTLLAPPDESASLAEWDLPVSAVTLREIVGDPRFGVATSPEMIAAGEALEDFNEDGLVGSSSSSSGTSAGTSAETSASVETVFPGGKQLPEAPSSDVPPTAATERSGETDPSTGQTDASAGP